MNRSPVYLELGSLSQDAPLLVVGWYTRSQKNQKPEGEDLDELKSYPPFHTMSDDAHVTTGTQTGVWQGGIATEYPTSLPLKSGCRWSLLRAPSELSGSTSICDLPKPIKAVEPLETYFLFY